jgi:hypothetical protein
VSTILLVSADNLVFQSHVAIMMHNTIWQTSAFQLPLIQSVYSKCCNLKLWFPRLWHYVVLEMATPLSCYMAS